MALSNSVQNARHTAQEITWTDEDGTPQDLTNAVLTGRMLNKATGQATALTGVLTVTDPTTGQFTWKYGEEDTALPGTFYVQFIATYPDDLNDKTLIEKWEVEPAISI